MASFVPNKEYWALAFFSLREEYVRMHPNLGWKVNLFFKSKQKKFIHRSRHKILINGKTESLWRNDIALSLVDSEVYDRLWDVKASSIKTTTDIACRKKRPQCEKRHSIPSIRNAEQQIFLKAIYEIKSNRILTRVSLTCSKNLNLT